MLKMENFFSDTDVYRPGRYHSWQDPSWAVRAVWGVPAGFRGPWRGFLLITGTPDRACYFKEFLSN